MHHTYMQTAHGYIFLKIKQKTEVLTQTGS